MCQPLPASENWRQTLKAEVDVEQEQYGENVYGNFFKILEDDNGTSERPVHLSMQENGAPSDDTNLPSVLKDEEATSLMLFSRSILPDHSGICRASIRLLSSFRNRRRLRHLRLSCFHHGA